ncbi:MAG: hypothetical protein HN560_00925 [Anaerolineae bacterium]|jgi:uncharacterized membrane protein SpoIIM required for sporulation|nr:hypothetical protein [Anaerolineae bacterium]MBT7599622.1 hypothetical protein [Anaerolineae bacterium]
MKRSKRNLREPIQNRSLILLLIFLVTIIITTATFYISAYVSEEYHQRLENQSAHQSLGEIILLELTLFENELNNHWC